MIPEFLKLKTDPDLLERLKAARIAWDAMSSEDKRLEREKQRRSWIIGEMMLEYPYMTYAEAEAIYERLR